jgi:hypothetical protein
VRACHRVDDDLFLITAKTIEHLNATAAWLWTLMTRPKTRSELFKEFKERHPSVPSSRLSADLGKMLRSMERKKLVTVSSDERQSRKR